MSVAQIFEKLEQNFNADAAEGLDLVFQFDIEDDKTYHLVIKDGTCKMAEGAHDDPSVTLIMNSETLQGIVSGETDGMQADLHAKLFHMETELPPIEVMFLYRMIDMMGAVADQAERIGRRLELLLAK